MLWIVFTSATYAGVIVILSSAVWQNFGTTIGLRWTSAVKNVCYLSNPFDNRHVFDDAIYRCFSIVGT